VAVKLREYLEGLSPEMFPRFAGHVKGDVEMTYLSRDVWRRVVRAAIEGTSFQIKDKRFTILGVGLSS